MGALGFIGLRSSLSNTELKKKYLCSKIFVYIEFKWLRQEKQLCQQYEDTGQMYKASHSLSRSQLSTGDQPLRLNEEQIPPEKGREAQKAFRA
jgi:hypothetical protein